MVSPKQSRLSDALYHAWWEVMQYDQKGDLRDAAVGCNP